MIFYGNYQKVTQISNDDYRRKRKRREKKFMEKDKEKKLHLSLDINLIRFSTILRLRKLFHTYPGICPILLAFHDDGKIIGTIEVISKWGISWNDELKSQLEALSFIESFTFCS